MIFSFKNGYKVRVTDTDGKTQKECYDIAKKLVGEMEKDSKGCSKKDAVELSKTIYTKTSFSPMNMKKYVESYVKEDKKSPLVREAGFLKRDLEADTKESHKNYVNTYRKEVLDKIVDEYAKALKVLKGSEKLPEEIDVDELDRLYNTVLENWGYVEKEKKEDINALDADDDGKKYLVLVAKDGDLLYIDHEGDLTPHERFAKAYDYEKEAYEIGKATGLNFRIIAKEDRAFKDARVKDIPEFDPEETYAIKNTEWNAERLKRELAHNFRENADFSDYEGVIKELDDLIAAGSDLLTQAGWTRADARGALKNRYTEIKRLLRKAGETDKVKEIDKRIVKLKNVWDLAR